MTTYQEWAAAGFPPLPETPSTASPREGNPAAVIAATRPLAERLWALMDDDEWEDDDDEQRG